MALAKGDLVHFGFTIEHPVAGRRGERKSGTGEILNDQVAYESWPPGRYVKVIASPDYPTGKILAVATHNLRRITKGTVHR